MASNQLLPLESLASFWISNQFSDMCATAAAEELSMAMTMLHPQPLKPWPPPPPGQEPPSLAGRRFIALSQEFATLEKMLVRYPRAKEEPRSGTLSVSPPATMIVAIRWTPALAFRNA